MNIPKNTKPITDSKRHRGRYLKGRHLILTGIKLDPTSWMVFDESKKVYEEHKQDELNNTCATYHFGSNKLQACVFYVRLFNAYKRSAKQYYIHPIKLRNRK